MNKQKRVLFALITISSLLVAVPVSAGSLIGSNINDVQIPDGVGTYAASPIIIAGAPNGAVVTKIEYTFLIVHADGRDLDVDLNDHTRTSAFKSDLWRGSKFFGGTDVGVNPVKVGTIASGPLIGQPVNQTWYLAAADSFPANSGKIDLWSITLYWAEAVVANRRPGTPSNVEPGDGANVNTLTPTLRGSAYSDPDGDAHSQTWWEIKRVSDSATVWDSGWRTTDLTSTTVPAGKLAAGIAYKWRVRYMDSRGDWSENSSPQTTFTVVLANRRPGTPSNVELGDGSNVNTLTPTLRGSAYGDPDGDAHSQTWWEIKRVSDSATVWDSGWRTTDLTSTTVPAGKLAAGIAYKWRVRYMDSRGDWSENPSTQTTFTVVLANPPLVTPPGEIIGVSIKQDFIPAGRNNRPAYPLTANYITIHDTDNSASTANALMHANYVKNPGTGVDASGIPFPNNPDQPKSWHFTVDDQEIYQHLPLNENGWHAGDGANGTGNRQSIGIEICMNSDGNRAQAEEKAAWLTAKLLTDLNLSLDRVKQHNNWSGKNCPSVLRGRPNGWQGFLDRVAFYRAGSSTEPPSSAEIRVTRGTNEIQDGEANAIGFGTVQQGQSSPSYTLKIWNDGGQTLTVGAISVPSGFSIPSAPPSSIAAGQSAEFILQFDTTVAGTKAGEVSFSNSDANENPFNFGVSGTVTPTTTFTLTTDASGGTVVKNPNQTSYSSGSQVVLTPVPIQGHQFSGWSGDASGSANPLTMVMTGNKTVTANFTSLTSNQPTILLQAVGTDVASGTRVTVPIKVKGFSSVTSFQFTVQWDPAVLTYVSNGTYGLTDLAVGNFGSQSTSTGRLTVSWDPGDFNPRTVADGTTLFVVTFTAAGANGTQSTVTFVDSPTAREVTVNDNLKATAWESGTVRVSDPNTPPIISNIQDQSTTAGTPTAAVAFTVGDTETPANSLTISKTSSNQTLIPDANIVIGGNGANRTVTITPTLGQSGLATITVTVSDGQLSASDTFVIAVTRPDSAPTSVLAVANIATGAGATHTFTVTYSDDAAIKISSLDNIDIRVTGPNGFNSLASFASANPATDGTPRTATYRINAPGGTWDNADNGEYVVSIEPNQVSDTSNNFVAAARLGTFQVTIPPSGLTQSVSGPTDLKVQPGGSLSVSVSYTTSDGNNKLSGLSLRLHYDSRKLTWNSFNGLLNTGLFGQDQQPRDDTSNYDQDNTTDKFMQVVWSDVSANWPNAALPVTLYRANFTAAAGLQNNETTVLRFTAGTTAPGYSFQVAPVTVTFVSGNLDIDGDGTVQPFTDGFLLMRYLFEVADADLIKGAVGNGAVRTTAIAIKAQIQSLLSQLDIDSNGTVEPFTDGFLIMRHLFEFTDSDLIRGAVGANARRTTAAEIKTYIAALIPRTGLQFAIPTPQIDRKSNLPGRSGVSLTSPQQQRVTPAPLTQDVAPSTPVSFDLSYSASDNDNTLSGLRVRIHFDSRKLTWQSFSDVLPNSKFGEDSQSRDDSSDLDSDPTTDKYLQVVWTDFGGNWPNMTLPVNLLKANFVTTTSFIGTTKVNFTSGQTSPGYTLAAPSTTIQAPSIAFLPTVTISASDSKASESGADTGSFTFSRTGSPTSPLTVNYMVVGTATPGADYAVLSGSVTIPSGLLTATISLNPIDDVAVELLPDETVVVTLSASATYIIGAPGSATVTIADNDSISSPNPTISPIPDQKSIWNKATEIITLTVNDDKTPAASLRVTATSSNLALVPDANIQIVPADVGRPPNERRMIVIPAPNGSGEATITLTVTDTDNLTGRTTVLIKFTAPPEIGGIRNQTIPRNGTTGAIAFTVLDADTFPGLLDTSLRLSADSSNKGLVPNSNIVLGGSGTNRTINITPAPNQEGVSTITVTVTDADGLSASAQFLVTVATPKLNVRASAGPNGQINPSGVFEKTAGEDQLFTATPANGFILGEWLVNGNPVQNGGNVYTLRNVQADTVVSVTFKPIPAQTRIIRLEGDLNFGDVPVGARPQRTLTISNSGNSLLTVSSISYPPGFSGSWSGTIEAGKSQAVTVTFVPTAAADYGGNADVISNKTEGVPTLAISGRGTIQTVFSFANSATITVRDNTTASPYPSTIPVLGVNSPVSGITVTLSNLSHTYTRDISVLLAGPKGQKIVLMRKAGGKKAGATGAGNVTLTFKDAASSALPSSAQISAGSYRPSDWAPGTAFPSPVPVGPYSTALSDFSGVDANGNWSLYVTDNESEDVGAIEGGWSLSFSTETVIPPPTNAPPTISAITDQTTFRDTSTPRIAFNVADKETAGNLLTVTATSSNSTLVSEEGIFLFSGDSNRTIMIAPGAGQVGATRITLTVTDAGGKTASINFTLAVTPPIVSRGDFDSDGFTDVVFQDANGFLAAWLMNGSKLISAGYLEPSQVGDANYRIVASADFNGDASDDLVFQNRDGKIAVWFMNGTRLISAALFEPNNPDIRDDGSFAISSDPVWKLAAAADLNGDGKPDLIFQHTDGTIDVWIMDGINRIRHAALLPNGTGDGNWRVVGAGDFNGDGKLDLVFQHSNGDLAVWYLDNFVARGVLLSPQNPGSPNLRVVSTADRNRDGKPDLLFQHRGDGSLLVWFMDGINRSSASSVDPTQPGGTWKVVAP